MYSQLKEARELAAKLYEDYISPFDVLSELNEKFEGIFYLHYGNIFRCINGSPIADMVYDKSRNLLEANDD